MPEEPFNLSLPIIRPLRAPHEAMGGSPIADVPARTVTEIMAPLEAAMREAMLQMFVCGTGVLRVSAPTAREVEMRRAAALPDLQRARQLLSIEALWPDYRLPLRRRGLPRPMFSFKAAGMTERECLDELAEKLPEGVTPEMMAAGKPWP